MRGQKYDKDHSSVVVDETTQIEKGGEKKVSVDDETVIELLSQLLNIAKKIELHLQVATDERIGEGDI